MRSVRLVIHGVLLLVAVRIWDLLILQQHQDRPLLVAAWLVGAFLLVVAVRSVALRTAEPDRTWLERRWAALGGRELVLAGYLFILLFAFHWGYTRAATDGREYFLQVRSLIIDRDLELAGDSAVFGARGTADVYPFGGPLLWVPFFVAGHLWLWLKNLFGAGLVRDGFGNPYQMAIGLGTLLYGYTGLVLAYRVVRQYVPENVALAATLTVSTGSFIGWYLVVEASMVHGVSLFATTLFLYVWHQTRGRRSLAGWIGLGAAAGLMTMVRWQNALFVVVVLPEIIGEYWRLLDRPGLISSLRRHAAGAVAGIVVFAPQLLFWKLTRGGWFAVPTSGHRVDWSGSMLADVLFSPNRGLFTWTPVIYLAVLGAVVALWRHFRVSALLLVAFLAQVYVNSTVEWHGSGFGARRFSSCALLFCLGLAALIEWTRRHPLVVPASFLAALVVVNVSFAIAQIGRGSAFADVRLDDMLGFALERIGNPFTFPRNAWVALRLGVGLDAYERVGSQRFNNLDIDLGTDEDERFLGTGWGQPEQEPERSYRWIHGTEAVLVVPLQEADDYRLTVRGSPYQWPEAPVQTLDLYVNGTLVESLELLPGNRTYEIELSSDLLRPGINALRLILDHAVRPVDVADSADRRRLSARFELVSLRRRPDRAGARGAPERDGAQSTR